MGNEYIVLVADHDAKAREGRRACMGGEGYQAVTADRGDEALRLTFELRPYVIIARANLPYIARRGVCRAVRAELPTPTILTSRRPNQTNVGLGLDLGPERLPR